MKRTEFPLKNDRFLDETDRVSPEKWPFLRLKALYYIPCN